MDSRSLAALVSRADIERIVDPRGPHELDLDPGDRKGARLGKRQQRAVLDPDGAQELGA